MDGLTLVCFQSFQFTVLCVVWFRALANLSVFERTLIHFIASYFFADSHSEISNTAIRNRAPGAKE